jgi:hypothetical protein
MFMVDPFAGFVRTIRANGCKNGAGQLGTDYSLPIQETSTPVSNILALFEDGHGPVGDDRNLAGGTAVARTPRNGSYRKHRIGD